MFSYGCRNRDDVAGLLFSHLGNSLLRHEEISGDVRADHRFEILGRIFRERLGHKNASVIDQQIHAAEVFHSCIDYFDSRLVFADVAIYEDEFRRGLQVLRFAYGAGICDDVITLFEQGMSYTEADAAGGAGDDGGSRSFSFCAHSFI